MAYGDDWTLVDSKKPLERTSNLSWLQVVVPAGETVSQKVCIQRVAEQSVKLTDAGPDTIEVYIRSAAITPAVQEALEKAVSMKVELDRIARDRAAREKEGKEAVDAQARVRENLKTIQQGTDTYQRQLKKFDDLETQIETARGQAAELRKDQEAKRAALKDHLLSLEVE